MANSESPGGLTRTAAGALPALARYRTFWRRLGALLIDLLVLLPVLSLGEYLGHQQRGFALFVAGTAIACLTPALYRVVLHVTFGQTLGKMVTGVRLYHVSEDSLPSLRQCLIRELPDLLVATLTLWHGLSLVQSGVDLTAAEDSSPMGKGLSTAYVTWLFFDSMVLASNYRQRALHDWISGTVVLTYDSKRRRKVPSPLDL